MLSVVGLALPNPGVTLTPVFFADTNLFFWFFYVLCGAAIEFAFDSSETVLTSQFLGVLLLLWLVLTEKSRL